MQNWYETVVTKLLSFTNVFYLAVVLIFGMNSSGERIVLLTGYLLFLFVLLVLQRSPVRSYFVSIGFVILYSSARNLFG